MAEFISKEFKDVYDEVEDLLKIAEKFTDYPDSEIMDILLDSLRHAGDSVSSVFYKQSSVKAVWGGTDFTEARNNLAVALFSVSVSKVSSHGFDDTIKRSKAESYWKNLVSGPEGSKMGFGLLVQLLINKHGFQKYLDKNEYWVKKLEVILSDQGYINGVIVKELSSGSSLCAKMKYLFLRVLSLPHLDSFLHKLPKLITAVFAISIEKFVKTDNHLLFASAVLQSNPFSGVAASRCNSSRTISIPAIVNKYPVSRMARGAIINYPDEIKTSYGDDVNGWLHSKNGPKRLNFRTDNDPDNVNITHAGSSGCFIAGTKILMRDGAKVNIEHLHENDEIVGANGSIGLVSSEKVTTTIKEDTAIYGFNEEKPFFLACHPFWTQHGWCALSPSAAKLENSWLKVGQLTEGDYVKQIVSYNNLKTEYRWVEIKEIHHQKVTVETDVYGVHTREGTRSYHSNGYLVLQNYPEITMERIKTGMMNISADEKMKMLENVNDIIPILSQVMGPGPTEKIAGLAKDYLKEKVLDQADVHKDQGIELDQLVLPSFTLHQNAGTSQLGSYSMPKNLSLIRGHLFLDGTHVPSQLNGDTVSWNRPISADGKHEHGALKLYPDRQLGHAFVCLTRSPTATTSLLSANFKLTHKNVYKCYKGIKAIKVEKGVPVKPTKDRKPFGELEFGYDCSTKNKCKRVGMIKIPPNAFDTLDDQVKFNVDSKNILSVHINVTPDYQSLVGYSKFVGTFTFDFKEFSGYCVQHGTGESFAWMGSLEHDEISNMMDTTRSVALQSAIHLEPITVGSQMAASKSRATPPMTNIMISMSDQHLTVDNLITLNGPNQKTLHDLNFSLIQQSMEYTMDDSDRKDILGVVKPTELSGNEEAAAEKNKTFLKEKFANAYLMNALSQSTKIKEITDEDRDKLLFYWAGSGEKCIARDPHYTELNSDMSRVAFQKLCPKLNEYINSSFGGPAWAKIVFDRITEKYFLNGLDFETDISGSTAHAHKLSMILFCLSPEEDYGSRFYNKVVTRNMNQGSAYSDESKTKEGKEKMKSFMTDYIHQLIETILSGQGKETKKILGELSKQLNEAMKELNIETGKTAAETADDVMSQTSSLYDDLIAIYSQKSGAGWQKFAESVNKWMSKYPKLTKFGKFLGSSFMMACWATTLNNTITELMSWGTLSPTQKAQVVINTIHMSLTALSKVPDILGTINEMCTKAKTTLKSLAEILKVTSTTEVDEYIEMQVMNVAEGEGSTFGEAVAKGGAAITKDVEGTISKMENFFTKGIAGLVKVMGLLLCLAGCVAIGFKIADDFKSGAPVGTKVIDIIQAASLGLATIASFVGTFADSLEVIPVIGVVAAFIGAVAMFVGMFIKRDPPKPKKTKAELYVINTGEPFVDTLEKPTDEWLKNYHNREKKIQKALFFM